MPGKEEFDEQRYRDGLAAWKRGDTLRSVFEMVAKDAADGGAQTQEQSLCFALGYADGALAALRTRVLPRSDATEKIKSDAFDAASEADAR
jgi:hypothetical protein